MMKGKCKVSEGKSFLNGRVIEWKGNVQNGKHGRIKELAIIILFIYFSITYPISFIIKY